MKEGEKKKKVNPITGNSLTPQQELFCQYYAFGDTYANGTQSYILAYDIDASDKGSYHVARTGAYENLTKPAILARLKELIQLKMCDETVDNKLAFIIDQNADLNVALGGVKEYNKMKGRITEKHDITGTLTMSGVLEAIKNHKNDG